MKKRMRAPARKRWHLLAGTAAALAVAAATLVAGCAAPASQPVTGAGAGATVQPGIPRYYVELDSKGPVSEFAEPLAAATVRLTATGAVIASIPMPRPYLGFVAVTGAADDRTFVLLAHGRTDPFTGVIPERFFVLRIAPDAPSAAARARLTALPARDLPGGQAATILSPGEQVGTMALSADGRSLAAILTLGSGSLDIYNLATGKTRSWVWKPCAQCDQIPLTNDLLLNPSAPALSWTSDGSSVAFTTMSSSPLVTQLWLLHLGAPGNNAVADSSLYAAIHAPVSSWEQAVMTPDGKTVFLKLEVQTGSPLGSFSLMRIAPATGHLVTINTLPMIETAGYTNYGPMTADTLVWTNDNGSKIIIADARPGHTLGVYSGGRYTPLPWPPRAVVAAW